MSWFQENKFAGTVLGVTAVVSGALVYLGFAARSEAGTAKEREIAAVKKIDTLQAAQTYPNEENERRLEENLMKFALEAKAFQEQFLSFRPDQMKTLSPDDFNGIVTAYFNKLQKYYSDRNVKTETNQHFGLGTYANLLAKENDTAHLNYQREALEWLFMQLADAGINELVNVHRDTKVEAISMKAEEANDTSKSSKSKRKSKIAPGKTASEKVIVADTLPIEISFISNEESLQKFLTTVASSTEYFFTTKVIRVQNEETDPVSISARSFAPIVEISPEEEQGEGFGIEDEEDVSDFGEDKTIIKQVLGSENIEVFVKLDLVLFKDASEVVLPRLEEKKMKKEKNSKK